MARNWPSWPRWSTGSAPSRSGRWSSSPIDPWINDWSWWTWAFTPLAFDSPLFNDSHNEAQILVISLPIFATAINLQRACSEVIFVDVPTNAKYGPSGQRPGETLQPNWKNMLYEENRLWLRQNSFRKLRDECGADKIRALSRAHKSLVDDSECHKSDISLTDSTYIVPFLPQFHFFFLMFNILVYKQ